MLCQLQATAAAASDCNSTRSTILRLSCSVPYVMPDAANPLPDKLAPCVPCCRFDSCWAAACAAATGSYTFSRLILSVTTHAFLLLIGLDGRMHSGSQFLIICMTGHCLLPLSAMCCCLITMMRFTWTYVYEQCHPYCIYSPHHVPVKK